MTRLTALCVGHMQAWLVGILHGDISVRNILLSDDPEEDFRGFLHDFDYSSMTKDAPVVDPNSPLVDPLKQVAEEIGGEYRERTVRQFTFVILGVFS